MLLFFLGLYLEVESLSHVAGVFLAFKKLPTCLTTHCMIFLTQFSNAQQFQLFLATLDMFYLLIDLQWYFIEILICISLMSSNIKHLFIHLPVIYILSSVNYMFTFKLIFIKQFVLFLINCVSSRKLTSGLLFPSVLRQKQMTDFRSLSFSNICTQFYKFTWKPCFC